MAQTLEHNKEVTTVVPVTIPAFDDDLNIIQKLDDEPNDVGGLTAAELKAKFDEGNLSAQQYINNVLIPTVIADDLSEQARQAAEAERVANEIERVTNEQNREKAEEERVNETSGVVARATAQAEAAAESARKATQAALGQIVDGSLEPAKFSGESRSMMVRENLLDNWYFGNPVNQRGQTTYASLDAWSGAYAVDRWKTVQGTYDTDAQTYTVKQGGGRLSQLIENPEQYAGRTVTFSALLESGTQSVYADIYANGARAGGVSTGVAFESLVLIYTSIELPSDITNLDFRIGSNIASTTFKPVAAKLELGSEQTLAHQDANGKWVLNEIPNYAEELAKCQRYQLKLIYGTSQNYAPIGFGFANNTTSIRILIPTPATMRAAPTLSYLSGSISGLTILCDGKQLIPESVNTVNVLPYGVALMFTVSDATSSAPCVLRATSAYCILDANL